MEAATLMGISGLGELHVHRSPEQTQVKGLWYLLDTPRLEELLAAYEAQEVVTFVGPVSHERAPDQVRQTVQVKIRSLEMNVDDATGEVQVMASLYGLTADDFVL